MCGGQHNGFPKMSRSQSLTFMNILCGKMDFADVIKVQDLDIGKVSWIIQVDSI